MRTIDGQNTGSFTWRARCIRDFKLATRLLYMITTYFTVGALVRYRYRKRQRRDEVYWLDEPHEGEP